MYVVKKYLLSLVIISFFIVSNAHSTAINVFTSLSKKLMMTDVSQTSVTPIHALLKPQSVEELQQIVKAATRPIAVAGGRFSQGGHIAYPDGIVIDITGLNKVKKLDITNKEITVQTGITWREIQHYISPYLSMKVMQSYNDFTVGGSLSVNVHGRDIRYGPLIETITSIEIMLADGTIVTASRTENADLFAGAIGGYGALGIIIEATISLTDNPTMECEYKQIPLKDYSAYFFNTIKKNPKALLHNANLYPNNFDTVGCVTWHATNHTLTKHQPLRTFGSFYPIEMIGEQLLRRVGLLKKVRPKLENKLIASKEIVLRNYEMSRTVNTLEPLVRFPTTTVLQEYFIPINNLETFVQLLRTVTEEYGINVLNVSIRYVPQNTESLLSYAPCESFALVLYINFGNTQKGLNYAQAWTQKLIDAAMSVRGTYYLPYQLFGTQEQIRVAYSHFDEFVTLKKKYDPKGRFSNSFLKKYGIA